MGWLHQKICRDLYSDAISIAAGDANNDLELLEAADHAFVVRSPVHEPPKPHNHPKLYISRLEGPAGWADGIQHIIKAVSYTHLTLPTILLV